MVQNSIYTNPAAFAALQNLNTVNRNLARSSSVVSSGLKVSSALDNTSSFSIAQGIRGEIAAIDGVQRGITKVKGIADYTLAAAEGISGLIGELKGKLTELAGTNLSVSQRALLINDFNNLLSQGRDFARGAARLDEHGASGHVDLFSASAALTATVADVSVNINLRLDGTPANQANSITLDHATTVAVFRGLQSLGATAHTSTSANAQSVLGDHFPTFETTVSTALGHLGSKSKALGNHNIFLDKVKDARSELLGSYVDADLARESAKLTALQVQQQLAVQSVGIANQRPQSLLGLFR